MARPEADTVALGAVVRAHGLRGCVRVKLFHADSDVLFNQRSVQLVRQDWSRWFVVVSAQRERRDALLTLDGIADRDAAECLRGCEVHAPRAALPRPGRDEYYLADLQQLSVVTADGADLGRVVRVHEYPSIVCLEIRYNGQTLEVPLLDRYVVDVDVEAERAVVDHLDELVLDPGSPR